MRRSDLQLLALGFAIAAVGCGTADTKQNTTGKPPLEGVTLTLGVIGDPPLAAEVGRLAAEWQARTGGELKVVELSAEEAGASKADVLFAPTYGLGPLAEKGLLDPLPAAWRSSAELSWDDFLEIPRLRESAWGESIYAVPLGSPGLVLFYRKDALDAAGLSAPRTWTEYQQIAARFAKEPLPGKTEGTGPRGSLEPLGKGWAGIALLARAAAYVRHPNHYSDLFDVESMRSLIDGPPFVAALEELAEAYRSGPPEQLDLDPAGVREAFLAGKGALAITWLPAKGAIPAGAPACGFAELPGAARSFNLSERVWQNRDAPLSVPLTSVNGRLGAVVKSSPHKAPALKLLLALSTGDWGPQISHAALDPAASRRSQWASPEGWLPQGLSGGAAAEYASAVQKSAGRTLWMHALRIPGREKYLAVLDDTVREVVQGKTAPQAALAGVASRWNEITTELGRDAQRRAYQRSLGLEP